MSSKHLNVEQVKQMLRGVLREVGFGAQREFSRASGCSHSSVAHVLSGHTTPGPKILKALGLRRVVLYEVIDEPIKLERPKLVRNGTLLRTKTPPRVPGQRVIVHRMEK